MKTRLRRIAFLALCAFVVVAGCDRHSAGTFTPEDSDADFERGRSLERQGNQSEALASFLKVIAKRGDDNSPESHLEAGLIYQQHIKDQIAAIYHFRKYLELEPNSRQADLVRQRIEASKREFARTLPAHPEEDASVRLGYLDQLDQLQRENDRLKAEIAALRAALPAGSAVAAATSGGFDIPVSPPAPGPADATPAPSVPSEEPPIVRAPLSDNSSSRKTPQTAPNRSASSDRRQAASPAGMRHHTVQQGDTLYSLAQRYYGNRSRWKEIYQANRDILRSERDTLRLGMELKIP